MRVIFTLVTLLFLRSGLLFSQYPVIFGLEKKVSINGLSFDAMEAFISPDGNTLFFNSLNSGGNTNLYYATRINDTSFNYVGLVGGCYDPSPNHLDGVASLDTSNNFFWVSLRNYPLVLQNLQRGTYANGTVSNLSKVYGDFYINTPGWLIMDAAINYQGDRLYYCNALFNSSCSPGIPCQARLGVAQRLNDSTFNKLSNTDGIFSQVNDTNYIVYAPQVTPDGLELYFTRIKKNTFQSEICISTRNTVNGTFSTGAVIHSKLGFVPEAASPTTDKQKIYYHQKDANGIFRIYMRYRLVPDEIMENKAQEGLSFFPNPVNTLLTLHPPNPDKNFVVEILSLAGQVVLTTENTVTIDLSELKSGIYLLLVKQKDKVLRTKFQKL